MSRDSHGRLDTRGGLLGSVAGAAHAHLGTVNQQSSAGLS